MELTILSSLSSASTPPFISSTFKTHKRLKSHHYNPSTIKLTTPSSFPPLKPTLLRQPDYKTTTISTPEEVIHSPIDTHNNRNTTLDVLRIFDGLGVTVTPDVYASLIDECTRNRDAVQASDVYSHMKGNYRMVRYLKGSSGLLLFNRILMLFVTCDCLDVAHQVFDEMRHRNYISLAILIAGLVNRGLFEQAVELFAEMCDLFIYQECDIALQVVVACVLKACVKLKNVYLGKMVHGWLIKLGYGRELFVGTALVEFYGKSRCLMEANSMFFDQIQMDGHCDPVLWTSAIVNNCREGWFGEVIRIFGDMGRVGVRMNEYTISGVLKACGRLSDDGRLGRQVHACAIKLAVDTHVFVMCGLVDMYGRCGLLNHAKKVFDIIGHEKRSNACWSAMVNGLIQHGMCIEAVKLLYQMKAAGLRPKQSTVDEVRMACGSVKLSMSIERDTFES